jgi:hypothetical protein
MLNAVLVAALSDALSVLHRSYVPYLLLASAMLAVPAIVLRFAQLEAVQPKSAWREAIDYFVVVVLLGGLLFGLIGA